MGVRPRLCDVLHKRGGGGGGVGGGLNLPMSDGEASREGGGGRGSGCSTKRQCGRWDRRKSANLLSGMTRIIIPSSSYAPSRSATERMP